MATTDYCTLAEFKQWVGLDDTTDDAVIKRAITASSVAVDNFCHTRFGRTNGVRVFDTSETWRVRVDPVVTVTELATDDNKDGVFETVWASTDFQLLPLNAAMAVADEPEPYTEIHAIGTLTFPRVTSLTDRHGLIRVTGSWGSPIIPVPVTQATLLLVNRAIKRRNSPEGVASFDEFGTIRISARDDPDAVRYLLPYKTSRRRGGWAFA